MLDGEVCLGIMYLSSALLTGTGESRWTDLTRPWCRDFRNLWVWVWNNRIYLDDFFQWKRSDRDLLLRRPTPHQHISAPSLLRLTTPSKTSLLSWCVQPPPDATLLLDPVVALVMVAMGADWLLAMESIVCQLSIVVCKPKGSLVVGANYG